MHNMVHVRGPGSRGVATPDKLATSTIFVIIIIIIIIII